MYSLIFGVVGIIILLVLIVYIILVVAEWKILTKAGEKGWKSLIPVYNVYISHHIIGMSHVWFIIEIFMWIAEIVFELVKFPETVVVVFGVVAGVFTLISELVHVIGLCNCFGKGTAFKVGMVFLPEVFVPIIAFGKAVYTKPNSKHA